MIKVNKENKEVTDMNEKGSNQENERVIVERDRATDVKFNGYEIEMEDDHEEPQEELQEEPKQEESHQKEKNKKPSHTKKVTTKKKGKFKAGENGVRIKSSSPDDHKKGDLSTAGYVFKYDGLTYVNNELWINYKHNGNNKYALIGIVDDNKNIEYFGEFVE